MSLISREFFEGEDRRLSMTRLLCFLSWFPASIVVIGTIGKSSIEGVLGWYLGAYVLGYVGGKAADVFMKPKLPQEATQVTINQPDKVNM